MLVSYNEYGFFQLPGLKASYDELFSSPSKVARNYLETIVCNILDELLIRYIGISHHKTTVDEFLVSHYWLNLDNLSDYICDGFEYENCCGGLEQVPLKNLIDHHAGYLKADCVAANKLYEIMKYE